ncbi:alkaline ceramidase [Myxozyma melibiosi]|uniref:Alkaline ceramidase n=1 Tax=Myxozyma melibiosi TaxID=54550 RepID=A0ABR1F755_9ASCO
MTSKPWSVAYPEPPGDGFWGPRTSTIDWCEENYVVSPYVAEAVNTVTNGMFIALAAYSVINAVTQKLETRFILTALGFSLVGIGSWLFHMTLQYEYQLLDELPMIYATCIPTWAVFSYARSKRETVYLGIYIFVGASTLTAVYLYFKDPTIHQAGYAVLTGMVLFRSLYLIVTKIDDPLVRKDMWKTVIIGICTFLSGYGLWMIDIHFCNSLRSARRSVGMPLGFLLELHGWWHILTGLGVYYYLVFLEYLRVCLIGRQKDYVYIWDFGVFPHVNLRKPSVEDSKSEKKNN